MNRAEGRVGLWRSIWRREGARGARLARLAGWRARREVHAAGESRGDVGGGGSEGGRGGDVRRRVHELPAGAGSPHTGCPQLVRPSHG